MFRIAPIRVMSPRSRFAGVLNVENCRRISPAQNIAPRRKREKEKKGKVRDRRLRDSVRSHARQSRKARAVIQSAKQKNGFKQIKLALRAISQSFRLSPAGHFIIPVSRFHTDSFCSPSLSASPPRSPRVCLFLLFTSFFYYSLPHLPSLRPTLSSHSTKSHLRLVAHPMLSLSAEAQPARKSRCAHCWCCHHRLLFICANISSSPRLHRATEL